MRPAFSTRVELSSAKPPSPSWISAPASTKIPPLGALSSRATSRRPFASTTSSKYGMNSEWRSRSMSVFSESRTPSSPFCLNSALRSTRVSASNSLFWRFVGSGAPMKRKPRPISAVVATTELVRIWAPAPKMTPFWFMIRTVPSALIEPRILVGSSAAVRRPFSSSPPTTRFRTTQSLLPSWSKTSVVSLPMLKVFQDRIARLSVCSTVTVCSPSLMISVGMLAPSQVSSPVGSRSAALGAFTAGLSPPLPRPFGTAVGRRRAASRARSWTSRIDWTARVTRESVLRVCCAACWFWRFCAAAAAAAAADGERVADPPPSGRAKTDAFEVASATRLTPTSRKARADVRGRRRRSLSVLLIVPVPPQTSAVVQRA